MQNTQAGEGPVPTLPPHHQGDDGRLAVPYHPDHGNETYTTSADTFPPYPPDFASHPFNPRASIREPAVQASPRNQVQQPMFGAPTPLPMASFRSQSHSLASNKKPQPPTDMQESGILPSALTIPHVNARFFNPAMGGMPPPSFPMIPFNPLLQFQNMQHMSTFAGPPAVQPSNPRRKRHATPPVEIPVPTEAYIQQASQAPKLRSHPQPLLIILDLNGTLIFRKHKKMPPSFARRAGLEEFLNELTQRYSVMIWSSSKPATVGAICKRLFPDDQKNNIVAMWGRDKFDLTHAQYNAKLQVYKELRKVWSDPQIQAAYPGSEPADTNAAPSRPGGKFSKRNKERQQNYSQETSQSAVGRRWDQTNTILIDDSKLKALSEPYNILEIPEFTGSLNIDESSLFDNVLRKLDVLSRHDDVSKMLRLVNELAEKDNRPVLDMEFPGSEGVMPFTEEDVSDGGVKLAPPTNRKGNGKKTAAAQQAQTAKDTPEGKEIAEQKKAAKKARKQTKKQAKKAAQAARQQAAEKAAVAAQPASSAPKNTIAEAIAPNEVMSKPVLAPESAPPTKPDGSTKLSRRERRHLAAAARREAKALARQSATAEPESEPVSVDTRRRYNLRNREFGNAVPSKEADADANTARQYTETVVKAEGFTAKGAAVSQVQQGDGYRRERSPSSASDSSRNSLLDRLEDGLGIHRY